jgi:hypothetical protein
MLLTHPNAVESNIIEFRISALASIIFMIFQSNTSLWALKHFFQAQRARFLGFNESNYLRGGRRQKQSGEKFSSPPRLLVLIVSSATQ